MHIRSSDVLLTRTDILSPLQHALDDVPTQLREWGTDRVFPLPPPYDGERTIGASPSAWLAVQDAQGFVSRIHARVRHARGRWVIRDAGSKNGLWIDGERHEEAELVPGAEVGLGLVRLVVETPRWVRARALLARWLGWDQEAMALVDRALRSVRWFLARRWALLLIGEGDVVALARRLHDETIGRDRPFVTSDPQRRAAEAGTRHVANHPTFADALRAGMGGTVCVWADRLPPDFMRSIRLRLDAPMMSSRVVVCARSVDELRVLPGAVIEVPSLATRSRDLGRLIDEYAMDAIAQLGARPASYTPADHAWLLACAPTSHAEIERATLRFVALREFGGVTAAAERLGITHAAVSRWLTRRGPRWRRGK